MADKDMAAEFKLFLEWKAKRKEESKTDSGRSSIFRDIVATYKVCSV